MNHERRRMKAKHCIVTVFKCCFRLLEWMRIAATSIPIKMFGPLTPLRRSLTVDERNEVDALSVRIDQSDFFHLMIANLRTQTVLFQCRHRIRKEERQFNGFNGFVKTMQVSIF